MTRLVFLLAIFVLSAESSRGATEQKDEYVQTSTIRIPTVYASMGTPLFESLEVFERYGHLGEMKALIRHYGVFMTPIFRYGLELSCKEKITGSQRAAYLEKLRTLEEEKRRIMHHLATLTMKAVDEDDYATFASLVSLPLDELFTTMSKRFKAVDYYKAKRQSPIPAMDALAIKIEKHQKARRQQGQHKKHEAADKDNGGRNYELKQHLPSAKPEAEQSGNADDKNAKSGESCDNDDPSALKKIGTIFKSMGIDFDPSLLEEYKSHKPPSIDDVK